MVSYDDESSDFLNYQYLELSKIATLKFQKSLPHLPIPKLEETIDRYLSALKPIIHKGEQYNRTVEIATKFRDGEGKKLQQALIQKDRANKHTSYISEYWFDMYLSSRLPLVLNFAPFMAFKDDPDPYYMNLSIRATNMIISALRFRRSLEDNVLSPEIYHMNPSKSDTEAYQNVMAVTPESSATYVSYAMKAFPLDMSQYSSLFSSTRIPKKGKDELVKFKDSRHIVIIKKGQFYAVEVLDSNGNIRPPEVIYTCISHLANLEPDSTCDSITAYSTDNREVWAINREKLIESSPLNRRSLSLIDSALFTVSFDELAFDPDTEQESAAHNYLHGNSTKQKDLPCNRWFDKSFGLIFDLKAHVAMTFEHSWGDGVAVLRAFNDIYKDSTRRRFVGPNTQLTTLDEPLISHLDFELTPELRDGLINADTAWREATSTLDLHYAIRHDISREYFKKKKVSPDAMFQLSFQMAFYKLFNTFATTYESCSTAAFKKGRTEVVRAATSETSETAKAFVAKSKSKAQLRKLLDTCSKKHSQLTKEAAMGKGFDRHLFALKKMAEEKDANNLPQFFLDKSYSDANHFTLSTSSLYGSYFSGGGFAPVVEDGFGIGYGYVDKSLGLLCSSYRKYRDGEKFVKAIVESLQEIRDVLDFDQPFSSTSQL